MLHISSVSKYSENETCILNEVNLNICPGDMVYIHGDSNSGKTVLFNLIMNYSKPTKGKISLFDHDLRNISPENLQKIKSFIGQVSSSIPILNQHTVFTNIALPLYAMGLASGKITSRVDAALKKLSLSSKKQALSSTLSMTERQLLIIGRAIINTPKLIIADDPTLYLNPGFTDLFYILMDALNRVGVTILILGKSSPPLEHSFTTLQLLNGQLCKLTTQTAE